jgi:uncharacterized protein YndB with AHSA1/START domain
MFYNTKMDASLVSKASITIDQPASKVWEALTDPEIIKKYLFETNVETDWKEGSPITYNGEWEGKEYEDKGTILKIEPQKRLETTYWSSIAGLEDKPENYKKVVYELEENGGTTIVTITQDNNKDNEEKLHTEGNWNIVLSSMKKVLEA